MRTLERFLLARVFLVPWPILWLAVLATSASAALPPGRGIVLPLQDHVGNSELALLTDSALQRELGAVRVLAGTDQLRDTLRRLRIRDASSEDPDRLADLADRLGVQWFFLATLHEAREGRAPFRDASEGTRALLEADGAGDTPQIVVSAQLFQPSSKELWWAGFEAASGRDRERLLGLGRVEYLEDLLETAVQELVRSAVKEEVPAARARLRQRGPAFLRAPIVSSPSTRVAVIPLDSVAGEKPGASAGLATAALFAALEEYGFTTLLPGVVREILQDEGGLQYGGVTRPEWEALAERAGASFVATGTVETYRPGLGRDPDPWVAFSLRFLDTADGRIDWIGGEELTGRETAKALDRRRIYSGGNLTHEMMRSLFGRMLAGSDAVKWGGAK